MIKGGLIDADIYQSWIGGRIKRSPRQKSQVERQVFKPLRHRSQVPKKNQSERHDGSQPGIARFPEKKVEPIPRLLN